MTSWQLHSGLCWSSTSMPWSMGLSLCVGSGAGAGGEGVAGVQSCVTQEFGNSPPQGMDHNSPHLSPVLSPGTAQSKADPSIHTVTV